MRRGTINR